MGNDERYKKRILIIEDDAHIRLGVEINLKSCGYEVLSASDGQSGLRLALQKSPHLLILDLRLPDIHGLNVLSRLRKEGFQAPIIILSVLGEEEDKVAGLRLGADDYVPKPFGVMELMARVEAALRRVRNQVGEGVAIDFGCVSVDLIRRTVQREGTEVHLTPKEFDLLEILIRSPGRVHDRTALLAKVWGRNYEGTIRTVDNFMVNLRKKLEANPNQPVHIQTVRGLGYRFEM